MLEKRVQCPFCSPDKSASMSLNQSTGWFYCFRCGYKGREKAHNATGVVLSSLANAHVPSTLALPEGFQSLGLVTRTGRLTERIFLHYLKRRGLTQVEIDKFQIGFTMRGPCRGRVIFPIYRGNELVYFVARSIMPKPKRRYMNPPLPKGGVIFKTFTGKAPMACIVEGVFDAVSTGRVIPSIALLTKRISQEQLSEIRASCSRAIVMLDSDAVKEALEVSEQVGHFLPTEISLLGKGDPGEMPPYMIREQLSRWL